MLKRRRQWYLAKKFIRVKLKYRTKLLKMLKNSHKYLGSVLTWDNDGSRDIRVRISKAKGVVAGLNKI